jgi:hypothetical protein
MTTKGAVMGQLEVRWANVPTGLGPRRVPVLGWLDGEYLLKDDAELLFAAGQARWELIDGERLTELQALRLAPKSAVRGWIIHKESLVDWRGTAGYHALWQVPREEAAAIPRNEQPIGPVPAVLLELAIQTRAAGFSEVAGRTDIDAIIRADLLKRFRVASLDALPTSDTAAAFDFVGAWNRQLRPLNKKQLAHLSGGASRQSWWDWDIKVAAPEETLEQILED